jgi:transposase
LLAEFGISLPTGATGISHKLMAKVELLPDIAVPTITTVIQSINEIGDQEKVIDQQLKIIAKQHENCSYLMSIPGVGVTIATAMIASVPNIKAFSNARRFSAWLGITPKEHSSGNKRRIGAISKQGDPYLRTLLVHGARSAILQACRQAAKSPNDLSDLQHWILRIRERRPFNVATLAVANKMARIIYVVWTQQREYIK